MIKLINLKRKKAFTLVELVIVLAVIGVLAGILLPVMIGAVRSANVASANTSANDVRKFINTWITQMDAKGHTVNKSRNAENEPSITVIADKGIYAITFSENFWAYDEDEDEMKRLLNEHLVINLGYHELVAIGYIDRGAVAALCYCVNLSESTDDLPQYADFWRTDYWTSGTNGIAADGTVIGTSPQILNG
ncbi:MAG: prepilin-type N-terminal cleavage/methylation domain-containing protein [Oscillospiraceae bacterium]|nr:prepilin-type N-terminal cleavage/methylation domain-containing protein [Oscillospiraceae bacterium]